MKCPKCNSETNPLGPSKKIPENRKMFGCPKCGFVCRADGEEVKLPSEKGVPGIGGLADAITGVMDKAFKEGAKPLNPSEAAVIQAVISDLYIEAFSSGVKQGLLLGTIQTRYKEGKK